MPLSKRSAAGSTASPSWRAHEARNPRCVGSPALWRAVAHSRPRRQSERPSTQAGPERCRSRNRRFARSIDTGAAAGLAQMASYGATSGPQSRSADPSPCLRSARARPRWPQRRAASTHAQAGRRPGEGCSLCRCRCRPEDRPLRAWRGQTHSVLVREDGFEYEGQRYRSLTVIAERITGAHWSGPRFFSLTKRARISLPTETDQ